MSSSTSARVIFQPQGRQGDVAIGTTLLDAAAALGIEIEQICGGRQTCGKCKVLLQEGRFARYNVDSTGENLTVPGPREAEYLESHALPPNARLSCACAVLGDVVIHVPPESRLRKQIVRKAAGTTRKVTVDGAARLYYVELPPAEIQDRRGDWERLRDELQAVHQLPIHPLNDLRPHLSVLRSLQDTLAAGDRRVTVTVRHGSDALRVQPGYHEDVYGVAVDVGTTTLAGHLCHLRTGEILATASGMNPQVSFGEDLMSRISYTMLHPHGTETLHEAVIRGLNELLADLCAQAGVTTDDVVELVVVGNTTMHHLLLGASPRELGGAPFSLVTHGELNLSAAELGLNVNPAAAVYIPPCEAGHVGADNVAVLVAEKPYEAAELSLIIDVGTNGEILLGDTRQVFSASSPTGPAFEGAQIRHGMRAAEGAIERIRIDPATLDVRYKLIGSTRWVESRAAEVDARRATRKRRPLLAAGICGSGIIEAIAELYLAGLITPTGRFVSIEHPRLRSGLDGGGKAEFVIAWPHETASGSAIAVHSDDVRAIQLAKAALYAGTKLLLRRRHASLGIGESIEMPAQIRLAGGFGSVIDPTYAMILGMIPDCPLDRVAAVGNAAGDGARMLLLDRRLREQASWAARWTTYVDTAIEPGFQDEFVAAIDIPNAVDPFPNVRPLIEAARSQWDEARLIAHASSTRGRAQRAGSEDRAARRSQRAQRIANRE